MLEFYYFVLNYEMKEIVKKELTVKCTQSLLSSAALVVSYSSVSEDILIQIACFSSLFTKQFPLIPDNFTEKNILDSGVYIFVGSARRSQTFK